MIFRLKMPDINFEAAAGCWCTGEIIFIFTQSVAALILFVRFYGAHEYNNYLTAHP